MGLLQKAREKLQRWRQRPIDMVREEFHVEPDPWQAEALAAFADPAVERLAIKSAKGPGKTALLAWIGLNFIATRPEPKIASTSITGDNLDDNLWPEIAKWMSRSAFFTETFHWSKTRVTYRDAPANWFWSARTWPKTADAEAQAQTLAGLHADHILFQADEVGGIPQAVMATAEAALATGTETKLVITGNPTHTTGPLYRACTSERHLWHVITITGDPDDPRRSTRIKIEWARQQIASYGRENPWVKVNVLGEFPPSSINALLGVEEVEAAMRRHLPRDVWEWAQKRLGVDVARFGDDRTTIFPRQGMAAFRPVVMRQAKTTAIAARVAKAITDWGAELTIVDDTGHWGHGVIDQLTDAGYPVLPLVYSDKALDPHYSTRRCEIWMLMADWVIAGGALPNLPELVGELTEPTYTFIGGKFVVEPKPLVKERIGRSPDLADALAETFAIPDMPSELMAKLHARGTALRDANPYEVQQQLREGPAGRALRDFDPLESFER